jgi:hypothetical protein
MIKLREIYIKYEFYLDKELNELHDHIYIILKFLSLIDNEEDILKEVANNYIISALINYYNSILKQLKEEIINNNPYCKLIFAFIVFPYISLTLLIFGLIWRFKTNSFSVSSLSSQVLKPGIRE